MFHITYDLFCVVHVAVSVWLRRVKCLPYFFSLPSSFSKKKVHNTRAEISLMFHVEFYIEAKVILYRPNEAEVSTAQFTT